ncbi:hypothetical protein EBS02_10105, partial [bacterium]|nr:hypothetical protein [bacterium]
EAAVQMNFLDQNAVSAFFPTATRSLVSPNFEMQFNIGPRFEVGAYLLHLGYNFWHISKDHISKVEPIEETLYPLNIPDGIAPAATQQKLFLRLNYNMITPKHTWTLAGCLDQTMGSSGIGKDFNVALELSVDF